jgi:hypothetical protein
MSFKHVSNTTFQENLSESKKKGSNETGKGNNEKEEEGTMKRSVKD